MSNQRLSNSVHQAADSNHQQCHALLQALHLMHNHSSLVTLGDVHSYAASSFDYRGNILEAAVFLQQRPELRVEVAKVLSDFRICKVVSGDSPVDTAANTTPAETFDEIPTEVFDEIFFQARRMFESSLRGVVPSQTKDQADCHRTDEKMS